MKMQLTTLGQGISSAVFFWDEVDQADGKTKKHIQTISQDEIIDVADQTGHEIMAKYKTSFKFISYGDVKAAPAPANKMVKNEKVKDVTES